MRGPTLYRLAVERRYSRIPAHVQQHPADVYWVDHYGCTALHILTQIKDVDEPLFHAIQAIVELAPSLIAAPNHVTWTPLHYASEKRMVWGETMSLATELVLMLIDKCPEGVSIRAQTGLKTGKTPFHIACEANSHIRILRAMLRVNPRLSTEPYVKKDVYSVAEHPLHILWKNKQINNPARRRNSHQETDFITSITPTEEKMSLLLRAAYYGSVDDDDNNGEVRLVNAACSVRCPQDYFTKLLTRHPEQIRQLDHRSMLPLHYAIQRAEVDAQTYTKFVVESLLQEYPAAAAQCDDHGRLPLHVALMDAEMTWHKSGIQELVYAYPTALNIRDPVHHLVPFMASAYHAIKSRLHLSTTYELLLAAPDVIVPAFDES